MLTLFHLEDETLVQMYVESQDSQAVETLFYRHKDKLLQSILFWGVPHDQAENLVQETFYKVITSLNGGKYNPENKFFAWMLRIARNMMIDQKRRAKRGRSLLTDEFEPSFFGYDHDNEISNLIDKQHDDVALTQILDCLDQLPMAQKEMIVMRIFHEMTFKEIAKKLDISINTALGRMRYSLINLRKIWENSALKSS